MLQLEPTCVRYVSCHQVEHPVFLLIMVLSSLKGVAPARSVTALPQLQGVQIAVPFNVKISPAGNSSLSISADQQVLNAINSSVSDKVLYVGIDQTFETQQPVSATIFLPAGSLQQVSVLSSTNLVAVDGGFSVQALSAKVAGTSTLCFKNLVAQHLSVTSTGCDSPLNAMGCSVNVLLTDIAVASWEFPAYYWSCWGSHIMQDFFYLYVRKPGCSDTERLWCQQLLSTRTS